MRLRYSKEHQLGETDLLKKCPESTCYSAIINLFSFYYSRVSGHAMKKVFCPFFILFFHSILLTFRYNEKSCTKNFSFYSFVVQKNPENDTLLGVFIATFFFIVIYSLPVRGSPSKWYSCLSSFFFIVFYSQPAQASPEIDTLILLACQQAGRPPAGFRTAGRPPAGRPAFGRPGRFYSILSTWGS